VNRFRDTDDVITIAVDKAAGNAPAEIAAWMQEQKLAFPTLLNGERIDQEYETLGCPCSAVIDKQGVLRHASYGYSPFTMEAITRAIEDLRKEPAGPAPGN
jgi:hypothetical protein